MVRKVSRSIIMILSIMLRATICCDIANETPLPEGIDSFSDLVDTLVSTVRDPRSNPQFANMFVGHYKDIFLEESFNGQVGTEGMLDNESKIKLTSVQRMCEGFSSEDLLVMRSNGFEIRTDIRNPLTKRVVGILLIYPKVDENGAIRQPSALPTQELQKEVSRVFMQTLIKIDHPGFSGHVSALRQIEACNRGYRLIDSSCQTDDDLLARINLLLTDDDFTSDEETEG